MISSTVVGIYIYKFKPPTLQLHRYITAVDFQRPLYKPSVCCSIASQWTRLHATAAALIGGKRSTLGKAQCLGHSPRSGRFAWLIWRRSWLSSWNSMVCRHTLYRGVALAAIFTLAIRARLFSRSFLFII